MNEESDVKVGALFSAGSGTDNFGAAMCMNEDNDVKAAACSGGDTVIWGADSEDDTSGDDNGGDDNVGDNCEVLAA